MPLNLQSKLSLGRKDPVYLTEVGPEYHFCSSYLFDWPGCADLGSRLQ